MRWLRFWAVLGCSWPLVSANALDLQYEVTGLGLSGSGFESFGYSINNNNQITGVNYNSNLDTSRAFLWQNGVMTDLGTLGGTKSIGLGINDSGQITGTTDLVNGSERAFLWQNGVMTDLGLLQFGHSSFGSAINNNGQIVGYGDDGDTNRAILWQNGVPNELMDFGGFNGSIANGINNNAQVTGESDTVNGDSHAFLWQNGVMTDLGTLGGQSSIGWAINDNGQIVGDAETGSGNTHAFLWQNGVMTDLGTLGGGDSNGYSINASGQVTGSAFTGRNDYRAFLYQNGVMTDLNTLTGVNSGWTLQSANSINDYGYITGYGLNSLGQIEAFLLTPVFVNNSLLEVTAGSNPVLHGNYLQSAAGILQIDVASASNYGRLQVLGNATLPSNAQLLVNVLPGNTLANNQVLRGVISASGRLNSDGTFNIASNSSLFTFQGALNGNSVDLKVLANNVITPSTLSSSLITPNIAAAAEGVNSLCQTLSDALECILLGSLSPEQQAEALQSITPLQQNTIGATTVATSSAALNSVQGRLNSLQQGHRGGISVTGLTGGGAAGDEDLPEIFQRLGLFAKIDGGFGDRLASVNEAGYNFNNQGVTLGADFAFTDNFVAGLAFYNNHNNANYLRGAGQLYTAGFIGSIYSTYNIENFYVDTIASVGGLDYDSQRVINIGGLGTTARGKTTGMQYSSGINIGYNYNYQQFNLSPYIGFNYSVTDVNGYTETGPSTFNARYDNQSVESITNKIGARASYVASLPWGVITPQVTADWVHESGFNAQLKQTRFDLGGSSFGIQSDKPSRDYMQLGLSLAGQFANGLAGFVSYDTVLMRQYVSNHQFSGGIRWEF